MKKHGRSRASGAMQDAELALTTGGRLAVQNVDNDPDDSADTWSISGFRPGRGGAVATASNGGANGTDHWI